MRTITFNLPTATVVIGTTESDAKKKMVELTITPANGPTNGPIPLEFSDARAVASALLAAANAIQERR